jgi:hypothetical protein
MAALKMSSRFAAIASHNKDPSIWGWGLWYADKSGAWWGVGGWGKRPAHRHFGPATILNLYKIAHSESTVDKWDNSPSSDERARSISHPTWSRRPTFGRRRGRRRVSRASVYKRDSCFFFQPGGLRFWTFVVSRTGHQHGGLQADQRDYAACCASRSISCCTSCR